MIKTYLTDVAYDRKKGWPHFFLQVILRLLSWLYLAGLKLVQAGYATGRFKTYRPDIKVISVGNITLGGTGKTPLVIMLGDHLIRAGHKLAVLSRGYGPGEESDEALVLKNNLKGASVLTGADRIANLKEARDKHGVDTVVLDDGFQHWKLERDLDIVAIDAFDPFGNGSLLPGGILREPVSGLKRADIIFLTCSGQAGVIPNELYYKIRTINTRALVLEAVRTPVYFSRLGAEEKVDLKLLEGKRSAMLCGIGNPDNFKETLLSMGACIGTEFIFPDHHLYTSAELEQVIKVCEQKNIKTIITTEKDAVRLKWPVDENKEKTDAGIDVLVLHIEMKMNDEQQKEFEYRLSGLYNS